MTLETPTYPLDLRAMPARATVAQVKAAALRAGFRLIWQGFQITLVRVH